MPKVRTRFAPSPTGYLHIGSLRTALFAYLTAKSQGGQIILRIEDTDQERRVEGAVKKLVEILNWSGIEFDEGDHIGGEFGPYTQTNRLDIYERCAKKLLARGKAYRCFCSPERLKKMREDQQKRKEPPRYDRKCRDLSDEEIKKNLQAYKPFVIRQKMPKRVEVIAHDELRGDIKFNSGELEDHILIKSSNIPTYQFASVVDDHLMEISHVVRGEEWIPSFPKNILLYKAFDWTPPKFIHMPLTLNKTGGKLSKRQGDVSVEDFKAKGYLKEALINFCVHLGWHSKGDNEIFTLKELEKEFDYKKMGTSPAIFDTEKLDYLNGYYIREMEIEKLVDLCMPFLEKNLSKTTDDRRQTTEYIKKVVSIEQERLKRLDEIGELTEFFFLDKLEYDKDMLVWKKMEPSEVKPNLELIIKLLNKIPEDCWTNDSIEEGIVSYLKAKELRIGNYLWPMRVALTGRKASPGPFEVAEVLGKEITLKRIKLASECHCEDLPAGGDAAILK